MKKYTLGAAPVEVWCDGAKSYRVVDTRTTDVPGLRPRTVVLVPCDRRDTEDNARGLLISTAIAEALNAYLETP